MVGIVGGVREAGLQGEVQPGIYVVAAQNPHLMNFIMRIVVRTEGDLEALTADVRRAVHAVDPDQPVSRIRTLEKMVASTVAKPRFSLLLLGMFAALALVLALVGIYGITSYSVSRRTRELGLRMALGARPQGILGMVLRETALLARLGVLLGLYAAWSKDPLKKECRGSETISPGVGSRGRYWARERPLRWPGPPQPPNVRHARGSPRAEAPRTAV